jgi:hypothetical protein
MSVVREEYGPTLPELLGPRVRALPRAARLTLAVAAALAVLAIAWLGHGRSSKPTTPIVVRGPLSFNLITTPAMHRVAAHPGDLLALRTPAGPPRQEMTVRSLRLPPYRGDVSAELTVMSATMIEDMREQYGPSFVHRSDGRVNVNRQPGYQIVFQAKIGGHTTYGKRILLVPGPDPPPRTAADMTLLAQRSPAVPTADSVAANGPLKTPLRSFRFGTARP